MSQLDLKQEMKKSQISKPPLYHFSTISGAESENLVPPQAPLPLKNFYSPLKDISNIYTKASNNGSSTIFFNPQHSASSSYLNTNDTEHKHPSDTFHSLKQKDPQAAANKRKLLLEDLGDSSSHEQRHSFNNDNDFKQLSLPGSTKNAFVTSKKNSSALRYNFADESSMNSASMVSPDGSPVASAKDSNKGLLLKKHSQNQVRLGDSKGSNKRFLEQNSANTSSRMEEVIKKHHIASNQQKPFGYCQNKSAFTTIQQESTYSEHFMKKKKSMQTNLNEKMVFNSHQRKNSHIQQTKTGTPSNLNMKIEDKRFNLDLEPEFEREKNYEETFKQIHGIMRNFNDRKSSILSTGSNTSNKSNHRTTDQQPFALSRSNSRRTKDVLTREVTSQERQGSQFRAKKAPSANQKFFALKSTKALTVPQDVKLQTQEREVSRAREKSKMESHRGPVIDRNQSTGNLSQSKRTTLLPNSQVVSNEPSQDEDQIGKFLEKEDEAYCQEAISRKQSEIKALEEQVAEIEQRYFSTNSQYYSIGPTHHTRTTSGLGNNSSIPGKKKCALQKYMGSNSQSNFAQNEVNMNKYLRGNIKKIKIGGSNYAQLVNYAKQKFTS